ncbi:uncharacterized protein CIMG_12107 [Coccidioides immitis RS]|uniref:Uncharacterized protein n=4 Tax=Coccidioides immitis TaxID=5501 RepID=A0A0D8JX19_COCIM|nr:uncharacterized protein CIMG_12107 [Coccidioides immitis RS]KJF60823.1 hypothetical protein CIMG_12107 [Coccidioides immitis RS]KMP06554.1 hypothetical protein CIRG_06234 [Coccidioides immitis RMSCC 2394]KMU73774.1 hypothetical protein CISG_03825 [Coccidioides immitis RMSCC 3703]KMU84124.1 hypothetical protein CIHG_01909 [Coccidioides immitis H538.4]
MMDQRWRSGLLQILGATTQSTVLRSLLNEPKSFMSALSHRKRADADLTSFSACDGAANSSETTLCSSYFSWAPCGAGHPQGLAFNRHQADQIPRADGRKFNSLEAAELP